MKGERTFVVVGAALAGAKAAETLRTEGFDGRVVLVGEEPVRPYERPPLSKEYLRGEKSFDQVAAVHPAGFYEEHDIEVRTSTSVAAIDVASSEVVFASGERVHYGRLLLATGAVPRRLSVPGADLDGVLYLRTVADADVIATRIRSGARVVVIGAGWIGCEVAASARQLGSEVAMVEPSRLPLEGALGPELGAIYRDLHAADGVEMHLGVRAESMGTRSAEAVRLSDGTSIAADTVVVGVGAGPTELVARGGARRPERCRRRRAPRLKRPRHLRRRGCRQRLLRPLRHYIRLEHWSAALNQGPAAARAMLGGSDPYTKTPYFYSDQYDLGMEYRGYAPTFDRVVFRGDPAGGAFIAFWIAGDRVVVAMNANIWDVGDAIEALLRSERAADPKLLADPDVDLVELAMPGNTSL